MNKKPTKRDIKKFFEDRAKECDLLGHTILKEEDTDFLQGMPYKIIRYQCCNCYQVFYDIEDKKRRKK